MKKRILALLLTLGMLLAILPAGVLAADPTSGTCGENLNWTLEGETLTISGTGPMEDYTSYVSSPWNASKDRITTIVMEPGVTRIGNYAFGGCGNLTSVTIPDSVTIIGRVAFGRCYLLTGITIPDSVTVIDTAAFSECSRLTDIAIPDGVTCINGSTFYKCTSLTELVIPDGVTSIGSTAFLNCKNLTNLVIPDGVTSIGSDAFFNCESFTSIVIPDGVTSIEDGTFEGCINLASITIPDGVTNIGMAAFRRCESLTSITIPDGVTSIGPLAFTVCRKLTDVVIPDGVACIDDSAFRYCDSLSDITIPDSVTSIRSDAFSDCPNLIHVTIPASVTEIEARAFGYCGDLKTEGFTIFGHSGTAAEAYAKNNGFPFIPLDDPIVFDDVVEGSYYAEAVAWAVSKGITNGTSETTFSPNNGCTRAQAVAFLWRAAGSPEPESSENPFTDVKDDTYYDDAVLWAVENGITNGVTADRFAPNSTCTRAQIVTFLYRFADQPAVSGDAFPDVPEDSFYADAVRWAVAKGITNGNGGNFFSPQNTCTRGQIVTFLYRDLA